MVSKGAGAGVLKDIDLMIRLTEAVVKVPNCRLLLKPGSDGMTRPNIEEVAERLQDVGVQALSIHGRTRCQLYKGEADWTLIGKVKITPASIFPSLVTGISTVRKKLLNTRTGTGWMAS